MTEKDRELFFLQKVAAFVKLSTDEIHSLKDKVAELSTNSIQLTQRQIEYEGRVKKAADALYAADFITDDIERRAFLKKAKDDPSYLADVLTKVCAASDVALIGLPAKTASVSNKLEEYDPVMARAFGWPSQSII